jgi:REP element-mobilizing transposase RayT
MPQSLAHVLIHVIFSTKNRLPLITTEIQQELYAYMATACQSCLCPAHRIGGTLDHVHLVASLSRTASIADWIGSVKADSSKWAKTNGRRYARFAWQGGYGAFSIGQSQLGRVKAYIGRQKEHHGVRTFQEEFREFLEKYEVQYDERYVWD